MPKVGVGAVLDAREHTGVVLLIEVIEAQVGKIAGALRQSRMAERDLSLAPKLNCTTAQ